MHGPLGKKKKHSEARPSHYGLQIVSLLAACDNKTKQNKKISTSLLLRVKMGFPSRKQMVTPCLWVIG